jgi:endonuclease YncB( thermonuclease family)
LIRGRFGVLLVLGVLLITLIAHGKQLSGQVVRVIDGDSLEFQTAQSDVMRVRIAGIDAPEWDQPYGEASKAYLRQAIEGKTVRINASKVDGYGRWVAHVHLRQTDIGLQQVQQGLAWVFRRYEHELSLQKRQALNAAETTAQKNHLGLWQQTHPIPPWEWRHQQQHQQQHQPQQTRP